MAPMIARLCIVLSCLSVASLAACSGGSHNTKCVPGANTKCVAACVPDTSVECACPTGQSGRQTCTSAGTFAACACADLVPDAGGPAVNDSATTSPPDAPATSSPDAPFLVDGNSGIAGSGGTLGTGGSAGGAGGASSSRGSAAIGGSLVSYSCTCVTVCGQTSPTTSYTNSMRLDVPTSQCTASNSGYCPVLSKAWCTFCYDHPPQTCGPLQLADTGTGGSGGASAGAGGGGTGGSGGATSTRPTQNIESMRIDPADSLLVVQRGEPVATTSFRAFATMQGSIAEVEITDRTVFYVPDNFLVGSFPQDGSSQFSTRSPPTASSDPPQRGGKVTIQAQAASSDAPITTVTTTLTVKIIDTKSATTGSPGATPALPSDPGPEFTGTDSATLAPKLVYPNDGVLLPPNLQQLEVHFLPGSKTGELYEISILSDFSEYRAYTRCYADPAKFLAGSCAVELDPDTVNVIAESNRGGNPLTLAVRGTDENGNVGSSASVSIQFAADRVDGAIYYWTATQPMPSIMRFDFGSQSALSAALRPSDLPDDLGNANANQRCVGCHALSRDGSRMVAATGAFSEGNLVYLNDLSQPRSAAGWLTVDGRGTGIASQNRVLTASFNPDGTQFVADAPANDTTLGVNKLAFHDGVTGLRQSSLDVGFPVGSPDWSSDGQTIALTHIYGSNSTTIQFQEGGISVIRHSATGWTTAEEVVLPHTTGKSRYTPSFVPDASFLLYSEATQQTGDANSLVDGYADPSATVWAVQPKAQATPVLLARANAASVADKLSLSDGRDPLAVQRISRGMLMNTFPRSTPFAAKQNGHKLFWFTVASQRRAGLRLYKPNPSVVGDTPNQLLLWMFALDADQVLAGQDGSYPGFFLPFQDLTTSNHMAAWTQKYVSSMPPPPPPPTPTPPPLTVQPPIP